MRSSMAVNKLKRFLAIILVLFTLSFAFEPITSLTPVVSAQTRYRRRHRSFWKKHRDKLTVAGSALGGAAIGGLAGGKKGAAIGSLVGAGSGALYTYKIRKRHRHRRY
ncbi:MAG TPA: hypothetical protein VIV66_00595 [Pyrinomonadaceae bacterium]